MERRRESLLTGPSLRPDTPSYRPVLQWLVERAAPDLIPTAAARTRRNTDLQPELQTDLERNMTGELADLTARYESARSDLESRLAQARAEASPVRHAMLFGTGSALETAMAEARSPQGCAGACGRCAHGARSAQRGCVAAR